MPQDAAQPAISQSSIYKWANGTSRSQPLRSEHTIWYSFQLKSPTNHMAIADGMEYHGIYYIPTSFIDFELELKHRGASLFLQHLQIDLTISENMVKQSVH